MKLRLLLVLITAFVLFLSPVVVLSVEDTTSTEQTEADNKTDSVSNSTGEEEKEVVRKEEREGIIRKGKLSETERSEKIKDFEKLNREKRCQQGEAKIDKWISSYEDKHSEQVTRYEGIGNKLVVALDRLEELGIDVSVVRADLEYIKTEKEQIVLKQQEFVIALKKAKVDGCDSQENLQDSVRNAFEILNERKEMSKNLRDFIRIDLKADLLVLKEEVGQMKLELQKNKLRTDDDR